MSLRDKFGNAVSPSERMVDIQAANPITVSLEEQEAAQREVERNAPGFGEQFELSRDLDSISANAARYDVSHSFEHDDSYEGVDDKTLESMVMDEGIPFDVAYEIGHKAVSEQHFNWLKASAQQELENERRLAEAGWPAIVTRVGVNLFDETALATGATMTPISAALIKGSRLVRIAKNAGIIGAENAAIEAAIVSGSVTKDEHDVLFAAAIGATLGGGIGALTRAENNAMNQALKGYAEYAAEAKVVKMLDTMPQDKESVGAALNRTMPYEIDVDGLPKAAPETALSPIRYDIAAQGKSSKIPIMRLFTSGAVEDAVGNADKSVVTQISASEIGARNRVIRETQFRRVSEPAFQAWRKSKGYGRLLQWRHRGEFFREVGRAVRRGESSNPEVAKVANEMRSIFASRLRELKEAGIKGFDDVDYNSNYIQRIHSWEKVQHLNRTFGADQIEELLARSMMKASDDLTEEMARKVAKAYWIRLNRLSNGLDKTHEVHGGSELILSRIFDSGNEDELRAILRNEGGLGEDEIDLIILKEQTAKATEAKGKGTINRAKRRLRMDESYEMSLKDSSGKMHTVGIGDMLEDNAEHLMTQYLYQTSGWLGLSKSLNIRSRADFEKWRTDMRKQAASMGLATANREGGRSAADIADEQMEFMFNAITGVPLERNPRGLWQTVGRIIRDWNFLTMMNQVGFAQVAEFGNSIGLAGVRNTFRHVPELRRVITRMKNGHIDNELVDEVEAITGLGAERLRRQATLRYDDFGAEFNEGNQGSLLQKIDYWSQQGKGFVADISGMAGVTQMLHRMTTMAVSQRFLNMATGAEKINWNRMKLYGFSETDLKRVLKEISKHANDGESTLRKGAKIKKFNIDKWDTEVADIFADRMFRIGRRIIQENDVGQSAMFMHSSIGKILFQFRTFMVGAYTKQLLSNVRMHDLDTAMAFSLSMAFAGMAYTAQTSINSLGRKDAEKYRRERLSTEEIAKAAFQRAGFASLIPAALDSALGITGTDPIWQYGRSTGLATGAITGNPTVSTVNSAQKALTSIIAPMIHDDYNYSSADLRAARQILPFANAVGIRNVFQWMDKELNLPQQSR